MRKDPEGMTEVVVMIIYLQMTVHQLEENYRHMNTEIVRLDDFVKWLVRIGMTVITGLVCIMITLLAEVI